ncbi:hypothetical protein BH09PSE1_BH09PSE1_26660 [soil metagenome]
MREIFPAESDTPELRSLVHNLAGAAGTFGYPMLSKAAAAIDDRYAAGQKPEPALFARLDAELVAVLAAC